MKIIPNHYVLMKPKIDDDNFRKPITKFSYLRFDDSFPEGDGDAAIEVDGERDFCFRHFLSSSTLLWLLHSFLGCHFFIFLKLLNERE